MREAEGGIRPETCRTELISSFPLPGLGLLRGRDPLVFCLTDYIGGDDGGGDGGGGDGGDGDNVDEFVVRPSYPSTGHRYDNHHHDKKFHLNCEKKNLIFCISVTSTRSTITPHGSVPSSSVF